MANPLSEKITCAEALEGRKSFRSFSNTFNNGSLVEAPWWLHREWLRIETGVYPEPTSVITRSNAEYPALALHISKEDPTMVAYTPDRASGEGDRQVRTTLARFLTKQYPYLSDTVIRELQAMHMSELDTSFEVVTGMDIMAIYQAGGGTGACMSKSEGYFKYGSPTEVYDAPNISMAVLRDEEGLVTARCMLFTPTPEDRRFIRVYGDSLLRAKLLRSKYKAGTWIGAKFKTVKTVAGYKLPYLDANDSTGGSEYCSVAVIDEQLQCVSSDKAYKIASKFGADAVFRSVTTGGIAPIKSISVEPVTCALTGVKMDPFEAHTAKYWNGTELVDISEEATDDLFEISLNFAEARRGRYVFAQKDVERFTHRGYSILDTPASRQEAGFAKLNAELYPEDQEWYQIAYLTSTNAGYIKSEDAVRVAFQGEWGYVHESAIGKGYTKLHSLQAGKLYYAHPDTQIVKTVSGRKVVPGLYTVRKLYDGTYDFERNIKRITVLGTSIWVSKSMSQANFGLESPFYKECLRSAIFANNGLTLEENACNLLRRYVSDYARVDGVALYRAYNLTWAKLWNMPEAKVLDLGVAIHSLLMAHAEATALDYNVPPGAAGGAYDLPLPTAADMPPDTTAYGLGSGAYTTTAFSNMYSTATAVTTVLSTSYQLA